MKVFSPAKVNLSLNVLHKRKDGYHEIETIFERIDLRDEIELTPISSGIVIDLRRGGPRGCDISSIPKGPKNLAWRAAQLLKDRFKIKKGVRIRIKKNIPVAAGLGGGSSDAASVLLGLDRLWKLRLSRAKLMRLGAELGSDVPFFILQSSFALASGRGERVQKLTVSQKKFWHVLVKPPFGISTKEAYRSLPLTRPKGNVKMLIHSIRKGDPYSMGRLLTNSLEVALNERVTTISRIKKSLVAEGALGALLSGSGSCVFGLFSSRKKAAHAARSLSRANRTWRVFVAATY